MRIPLSLLSLLLFPTLSTTLWAAGEPIDNSAMEKAWVPDSTVPCPISDRIDQGGSTETKPGCEPSAMGSSTYRAIRDAEQKDANPTLNNPQLNNPNLQAPPTTLPQQPRDIPPALLEQLQRPTVPVAPIIIPPAP
jgi:hypothetical protein